MMTQYPVLYTTHFQYNKNLNIFSTKFRTLPCDPILYKEFIMLNIKTGNEVTFYMISNIYDEDARTCGWRFMASYDDVDRFPGLEGCFADILLK